MKLLTTLALLTIAVHNGLQHYQIVTLQKQIASLTARVDTNQRTLTNVVRDINAFEHRNWIAILEERQ